MQQYIGITLDAIEMIRFFYDLAHIHGSNSTCDPKGFAVTRRSHLRATQAFVKPTRAQFIKSKIQEPAILMPWLSLFKSISDLTPERCNQRRIQFDPRDAVVWHCTHGSRAFTVTD